MRIHFIGKEELGKLEFLYQNRSYFFCRYNINQGLLYLGFFQSSNKKYSEIVWKISTSYAPNLFKEAHLILRGTPGDGGEANVIFLYDGRVETVEI